MTPLKGFAWTQSSLQTDSPLQEQNPFPGDGGGELGLLWGCRQEPMSLHGLLSPRLDACAMDNQQLWPALLSPFQILRASALPCGFFFPLLSLFKTPFGCSTYFHTVSIILPPPSPPPPHHLKQSQTNKNGLKWFRDDQKPPNA